MMKLASEPETKSRDGLFATLGNHDWWYNAARVRQALEKAGIRVLENQIFPAIPSQVALTIAGHTHGGQVVLPLIGRPIVPSKFGQRYAIGIIVEDGKCLFVTPGIGASILPVRLGVPPEISLLTIN